MAVGHEDAGVVHTPEAGGCAAQTDPDAGALKVLDVEGIHGGPLDPPVQWSAPCTGMGRARMIGMCGWW